MSTEALEKPRVKAKWARRLVIGGARLPFKLHRLLGFAFASADLLVEVSPKKDVITFAQGDSEVLSGTPETPLLGRAWHEFVDADDRRMVACLLEGLEPGRRAGPVVVRLAAAERAATLTALRLPQNNGAISCTLSHARYEPAVFAGRLSDRAAFEAFTCNLLGPPDGAARELELSLVELGGLSAARNDCAPDARDELDARIVALLRAEAWGGQAATALNQERFALLRARGETPDAFVTRLVRLIAKVTERPLTPRSKAIAADGVQRPQQILKALRYALERFSRDGIDWQSPANLSDALNSALDRGLTDAGALGAAISDRTFRLAYQPVFDLRSRALHHFEVLVRFGEDESPFPQIRMAEELDLIEALDFAILERAVKVMTTTAKEAQLAVNVSGRTIISPNYIDRALKLIKRHPDLDGRLMFELTESAAIDDLALADRHIQALRRGGCEVCLDDFGAGAASFAYLQQLRLDVVKIDGRYIRDLQFGGRGATFIKHIVQMCREMGMKTLAEMVETSTVEDEVRRAGVDLAQGWLYGLAREEPIAVPAKDQRKPTAAAPR